MKPIAPDLSKRARGRWGEDRACTHYRRLGYQIVERHCPTSERQAEAVDAVRQATEMRWQYMSGLHRAYVLKEDI